MSRNYQNSDEFRREGERMSRLEEIAERPPSPTEATARQTGAIVLDEIAAESRRRMEVEGKHEDGSLADMAAAYVSSCWWKPKDRRRDLIRAAALIVAEIERLDRLTLAEGRSS